MATTAASGAHTVQIVAPATSALGLLVQGMASGTWADFPQGAMSSSLTNPGSDTDGVISDCSIGSWDTLRKRGVFVGGGHGNQYQEKVLTFPDSANAWNNTDTPPIPGSSGVDSGVHQFNSQTANLATGDIFINVQTGPGYGFYYRLGGTTTWINDNTGKNLLGVHAQRDGSAFNPAAGTSGWVLHGSQYGITRFDYAASSNKWALLNISGLSIDNAPVGFYDPVSQCAFICGGSTTACVRITAAGVTSQHTPLPIRASVPTPFDICGVCVDGYTTPGGVVRKPMIIQPGVSQWEYNGANSSWAQLPGTPPAQNNFSDNSHFYMPIPTYDCVMWINRQVGNSAICKVYKR